jgi:hypothetical protein
MAYGPYLRSKPRVQVLSGYDPMNPTGLKQTAPVKSGVTIQSGQAVVLEWNSTKSQYEWVLATVANVTSVTGAPARTVYIAWQDSGDGDVVDGGLTGLSSSGDYEFQTAFFDASSAYTADTPLTVSAATPGALGLIPATVAGGKTYPIVGRVVSVEGFAHYAGDPLAAVAGGVKLAEVGVVGGNVSPSVIRKEDSSTLPSNSAVIRFRTSPGNIVVPAPGGGG